MLIELQKIPCPVRFEFSDKEYIVEIQYFVTQKKWFQSEQGDKFYVFAVNTDGWDLLVDENNDSGVVMQKEYNDIDSLDVTITDLLKAKHVFL